MKPRIEQRAPLLRQLKQLGLEFDQLLLQALKVCASKPDVSPEDTGLPDSYITLALYRLNSTLAQVTELDEARFNLFHEYKLAPKCPIEKVVPGRRLCDVLNKAIDFAPEEKTISTGRYFRAIAHLTNDVPAWDYPGYKDVTIHNTFSIETLLWGHGYSAWTPLKDAPEVVGLVSELSNLLDPEDVQLGFGLVDRKIVIRPLGILGAYSLEPGSSSKELAILTHLKGSLGIVTPNEIGELEELMNSKAAREKDFQAFFESHSHFLRIWDHREVFPQVQLTRDEEGPLIPDFVLLDDELQRATIVDLKLPQARIVRNQPNRERFSSLIEEAKAQLLEYGSWFDDPSNRAKFKSRYGADIYKPKLGVVIGRQSSFTSALQRQKLSSRNGALDVVTYDDILTHARRRLALIDSAQRT